MKKSTILLILLALIVSFVSCGPNVERGDVEITHNAGNEKVDEGTEVKITVTSPSYETVDIYLFKDKEQRIDIKKGLTLTDNKAETTWTIPTDKLGGEYKFRAYKGGEDITTSKLYNNSKKINIKGKTSITFTATVGFGDKDKWAFDLLMSTDKTLVEPDPKKPGSYTIGEAAAEKESLVAQISSNVATGFNGEEVITPEAEKYDWFVGLRYWENGPDNPPKLYYGQFASDFTELNELYDFEGGQKYMIRPEYPYDLTCVNMAHLAVCNSADVLTAAKGSKVTVVITGAKFQADLEPVGLLSSRSEEDLELTSTSATVDSATQMTVVFDIPGDAPATKDKYTHGGKEYEVEWHLRVLQAGGYAYCGDFTVTE